MYIAFIRSALEYAAPVWFPFLSITQLKKLATVETKCLRLILGAPRGTPNDDLYLEANIDPLTTRLSFLQALLQRSIAAYHRMTLFTLMLTLPYPDNAPNALHGNISLIRFFQLLDLTRLAMMSIAHPLLHCSHLLQENLCPLFHMSSLGTLRALIKSLSTLLWAVSTRKKILQLFAGIMLKSPLH